MIASLDRKRGEETIVHTMGAKKGGCLRSEPQTEQSYKTLMSLIMSSRGQKYFHFFLTQKKVLVGITQSRHPSKDFISAAFDDFWAWLIN